MLRPIAPYFLNSSRRWFPLPKIRSRHSRARVAAHEAFGAAENSIQTFHIAHLIAAVYQDKQARRRGVCVYVLMLVVLVSIPTSLVITIVIVANGDSSMLFVSPLICFLFPTMLGSSLRLNASAPVDIEAALRHTLSMLGGIQRFPASIWASHNGHHLRPFPVFYTFLFEFLHELTFTRRESEVFHQLLADGFEGSLNDLVVTSRSLSS